MPEFRCTRCGGVVPDYLAGALMYGHLPATCFPCLSDALRAVAKVGMPDAVES